MNVCLRLPRVITLVIAFPSDQELPEILFRTRAMINDPVYCPNSLSIKEQPRRWRLQPAEPASDCSDLPASGTAVSDSSVQETAPASALSHFQKRCAAAYEKDPLFKDESFLAQYTNRHGLWWAAGDKLVIPDVDALRQNVIRECHDAPHAGHLVSRRPGRLLSAIMPGHL